jgi:hypothetical protein
VNVPDLNPLFCTFYPPTPLLPAFPYL